MTLDAERRRKLADLRRQVKALEAPEREAKKIARAKGRQKREKALTGEHGQRAAINRDDAYMAWIHEQGLACIACLNGEPVTYSGLNPIEAAHQWVVRGPTKGKRAGHDTCVPLCRWHHQLAPNACDKGQRAFWSRLEIDPADLSSALYGAFKAGGDGHRVLRRFTTKQGQSA